MNAPLRVRTLSSLLAMLVTVATSASTAGIAATSPQAAEDEQQLREIVTRPFDSKCSLVFFNVDQVVLRRFLDVEKYARNPDSARDFEGVDFSRDTLLAVELNTGWCRNPFGLRHRLLRDDARRRYVLEVRYTVPIEPCRARSQYELWLAVPAVPEGYTVDFDIAGDEPRPRAGSQPPRGMLISMVIR